jgi:hypothetical protein
MRATKKKRTLSDIEDIVTEQGDVHSSMRDGLVLAWIPEILKLIAANSV